VLHLQPNSLLPKLHALFILYKETDSFSGNALKLVTGAALAQLLGLIVSPIITRLFARKLMALHTFYFHHNDT
jgi:hypothetical protein